MLESLWILSNLSYCGSKDLKIIMDPKYEILSMAKKLMSTGHMKVLEELFVLFINLSITSNNFKLVLYRDIKIIDFAQTFFKNTSFPTKTITNYLILINLVIKHNL